MQQPAELVTYGPVRLRRWRREHVDELQRAVTESLPHLRPWMVWATSPYDHAVAMAFLERVEREWEAGDSYSYAIVVDGEVAGACGLERRIGPGALEIGYWLHPAMTGRGLATASAAALIAQAFTLPGVERVQIWHDVANTASEAIPRRLGFTEVERRTSRESVLTSGVLGVDVVWELRRPDR